MESTLTPIRIRRKRNATSGEAWKKSKRKRPHFTSVAPSPSQSSTNSIVASSQNGSPRPRKRKRREAELSRLEELPTEIIQSIFEHSDNLQLALSSPVLNRQLSNEHMCHRLTDRILGKVIGHVGTKAQDDELAVATRLLNSRFVTWAFFRNWLHERSGSTTESVTAEKQDYAALWASLHPSDGLVPPAKLLHGPWTPARIEFLRVLAVNVTHIASTSLYHADLAHEGLVQAINEHSVDAVHLLLDLGLSTSQELLRQAVIDCGCDQEVIEMLLQRTAHDSQYDAASQQWTRQSTLDTLDPMLWSWIERVEKTGDPKGKWLKNVLRANHSMAEASRAGTA